ncbi:hypothetical protein QRD90_12280 [Peribacillus frigoritolerans]|uniref:hypothetical protein n=1 Tax=Peribacillus frigoritolerans TaxID=450367 RepID=UPI002570FF20|nr:hypothetical protein [Peribacillus frigoritolerans]WJE49894.1 hypothetical protein QRD90_12280 [Peribacillus frigoritolerans]
MPRIPAVCDTCGTTFESGFFIENPNNINITFIGNKSGPCPNCGGMGSIPNFIGNAIEFFKAPETTVKDLQNFSEILTLIQNEEKTIEEIEDEIQDESPQINSILELLPRTREEKREDLRFWIGNLMLILQMFLTPLLQEEPTPKVEVNQVINHIYENNESNINQIQNKKRIPPNNVEKIGRN